MIVTKSRNLKISAYGLNSTDRTSLGEICETYNETAQDAGVVDAADLANMYENVVRVVIIARQRQGRDGIIDDLIVKVCREGGFTRLKY